MKIAVCIKEVIDARLPIQVVLPAGEVRQSGTERIALLNPPDRAALEVALAARDQHPGSRVEVFSVCEAREEGALYYALGRGADVAVRLAPDPRYSGPPYTALLLAAYLATKNFDLICCGDETLDNSSGAVGPLIAEILDLPQVTGVCRVREWTSRAVLVERNLDCGHRELVEMELPGLATFTADAAEPRYVAWRRLLQARRKQIPAEHPNLEPVKSNLPSWPELEKKVPPRARVKKKFTPDADLPPAERVKLIMAGGMAAQQSSQKSSILEGDADYLSEQLFRFLRHHEFI